MAELSPDSKSLQVYLFVAIDVKPGKREAFLEKIKVHGAHIRTESGCETLEIFNDSQNENQVCVWEVWTNRALWDAHMTNDASAAWQKIASEFVIGEQITILDSI